MDHHNSCPRQETHLRKRFFDTASTSFVKNDICICYSRDYHPRTYAYSTAAHSSSQLQFPVIQDLPTKTNTNITAVYEKLSLSWFFCKLFRMDRPEHDDFVNCNLVLRTFMYFRTQQRSYKLSLPLNRGVSASFYPSY